VQWLEPIQLSTTAYTETDPMKSFNLVNIFLRAHALCNLRHTVVWTITTNKFCRWQLCDKMKQLHNVTDQGLGKGHGTDDKLAWRLGAQIQCVKNRAVSVPP
jgi:hypothetical protein